VGEMSKLGIIDMVEEKREGNGEEHEEIKRFLHESSLVLRKLQTLHQMPSPRKQASKHRTN
jgi:hypothetical protein